MQQFQDEPARRRPGRRLVSASCVVFILRVAENEQVLLLLTEKLLFLLHFSGGLARVRGASGSGVETEFQVPQAWMPAEPHHTGVRKGSPAFTTGLLKRGGGGRHHAGFPKAP